MLVQHVNRGGEDVLKVYLDRVQPRIGSCQPSYCSACPGGAPARWCLGVAGITSGGCGNCNNLNLPRWVLVNVGDCAWAAPQVSGILCANSGFPWYLLYDSAHDVWNLYPAPGQPFTTPRWTLPGSAFNCQGPNTLAIQGTGTACTNWPATLTVTPC